MTAAESALLGLSEPTARVRTGRESGPGKMLEAPAGAYSVSHQLIEPGGIGRMTHPTKHKAIVRQNRLTRRWEATCTCGLDLSLRAHWLALRCAVCHRHVRRVLP